MSAGRRVNTLSIHWGTPQKYVDAVHEVFSGPPSLDPCDGPESIMSARVRYAPPTDGLQESWDYPSIYVNPPYGRGLADWIARCSAAWTDHRADVIALVPVATNTRHWKRYVFAATRICFLADTRLRFRINGSEVNKGASMACAAVYWGGNPLAFDNAFGPHGALITPARVQPAQPG